MGEPLCKIFLPAVRVNAKMNQKEWAQALGVCNTTVVHWENDKTAPNGEQLRKMSELSGIPIDLIFVQTKSTKSVIREE